MSDLLPECVQKQTALAFAPKIEFLEAFQTDLACPVLFEKIFRFARRANHLYKPARLVSKVGRLAIVTDAGRDAMDAGFR